MMGALWPFVMGSVALGLDAYVIAGLLPAVAGSFGVSESLAGLGVAAFTGCYAVAGPVLAGRAGKRSRRSLTLALSVFTLANVATALAPNITCFLLARVVAGAAAGVYSPLSSAVAGLMADERERGRALSLVLAGLAVGTVFGVPAGLLIADRWGWRAAIALVTITGGISLLGVLTRRQELPMVPASSTTERLRTLTRPVNAVSVSITLLTGIASLGLYTYITPILHKSSLHDHITFGIWVWGLGGATGALLIGRLIDVTGKPLRLSMVVLSGLSIALLTLLVASSNTPLLVLALLMWGLCGWASLAPQQHVLLETNPGDGATAVAANASANYLGSALGALIGSALIAGTGTTALITTMATISTLALLLQGVRTCMTTHPSTPSAR